MLQFLFGLDFLHWIILVLDHYDLFLFGRYYRLIYKIQFCMTSNVLSLFEKSLSIHFPPSLNKLNSLLHFFIRFLEFITNLLIFLFVPIIGLIFDSTHLASLFSLLLLLYPCLCLNWNLLLLRIAPLRLFFFLAILRNLNLLLLLITLFNLLLLDLFLVLLYLLLPNPLILILS